MSDQLTSDSRGTARITLLLHWIRILLLGGLLLILACRVWWIGYRSKGIDFYQPWAVSQLYGSEKLSSLYSAKDLPGLSAELLSQASAQHATSARLLAAAKRRAVLQPYSTPFFYAAFKPFTSNNYEADVERYISLLILAACCAVAILAYIARFDVSQSIVTMCLALLTDPMQAELQVMNVNSLQLLGLSLGLLLIQWRNGSAAAVLVGGLYGMLLLFKPNISYIVAALLIGWWGRGDRRLCLRVTVGLLMGMAAAFLASVAFFHSWRCWYEWQQFLSQVPHEVIPLSNGNFSLSALLLEIGSPRLILLPSLVLSPMLLFLIARGARSRQYDDLLLLALGSLIMLLAGTWVWVHYYLFTLPAVVCLTRPSTISVSLSSSVAHRISLLTLVTIVASLPLFGSGQALSTLFSVQSVATLHVVSSAALFIILLRLPAASTLVPR